MPSIKKSIKSAQYTVESFKELQKKIYDDQEIKDYDIREEIEQHPLINRPTLIRSKQAYQAIMKEGTTTKKYMLPGNIYCFHYFEPKLKEELEYYDRTPLILSVGITRTNDNVIREIGFNLHYYPPFARKQILAHTYEVFKPWFDDQFNDVNHKASKFISYERLKHIMRTNLRLAFGIKMYVPVLRGTTWQIPTRLLTTAFYTEGHFSKATMMQVFRFWRQFH